MPTGLAITRRPRERIVLQTETDSAVISCEHATRVWVDADSPVRVWREELARVCPRCDRWTPKGRPCEWCCEDTETV